MTLTRIQIQKIFEEELLALPDQAPLEHFVHHNNLHHYEDLKFEYAVEKAYLTYGRTPYMSLTYYREKLQKKEINEEFLLNRLKENGFEIQDMKLLEFIMNYLHSFTDIDELSFQENEDLIYDFSFTNLIPADSEAKSLWKQVMNLDIQANRLEYPDFHINRSLGKVNKALIPFISALLDQGQAHEQLSQVQRENIWPAFMSYLKTVLNSSENTRAQKTYSQLAYNKDFFWSYIQSLCKDELEAQKFIRFHLHTLPGWAGLVHKVSKNKEVIPRKDVCLDIYNYFLMRIVLSEAFEEKIKINMVSITSAFHIKVNLFYSVYYFGTTLELDKLFNLFDELNPLVLKRIFQQAYEDTYQNLILTGLSRRNKPRPIRSKYQIFFCIDDREESFRRYLEESSNKIETFGVAGFFGLDMMYQKINEPRARRFCPPAATPGYIIKEEGFAKNFKFAPLLHDSRHNFIISTLFNFIYAPFRALEMKWHLFFPRSKRMLSNYLKRTVVEKINFYYTDSKNKEGLKYGYTLEEGAQRVAAILKGAGLTSNFSPYILMIGHGHDSFNNPHVAAYRCGACSGANASPNARVFAKMANDPQVRLILKEKHSLEIPLDSYFIGGYHDTCNDKVEFFDIERSRVSPNDIIELESTLLKARQLNAKERCRKFYQEQKNLNPIDALRVVEGRSWRIAEPRPELNHATNALCIVGKRDLSKGLFLDRKSFLVSYDAKNDLEDSILTSLLSAVIPVCAGINLEYYFSKVDTENYGSGSKTSHNVTGLFGVMNGVRGDLRTGLVWQMVEYHDPLRILFIIEASEEAIRNVMVRNDEVKNLIENKWISLAIVNPNDSSDIKTFTNDSFHKLNPSHVKFKHFDHSQEVDTGLFKPVHFAYIGDIHNE